MNKKITIILLALAVLIIALVGVLLFVPKTQAPNQVSNSTETADWKTYRNNEYGFEFKYPSTRIVEDHFSVEPTNYNSDSVYFYEKKMKDNERYAVGYFSVRVVHFSKLLEGVPQNYADNALNRWIQYTEGKGTSSASKINIQGNEWLMRGVLSLDNQGVEYYYQQENNIYIIYFNETVGEIIKNEVLSTFKFTK